MTAAAAAAQTKRLMKLALSFFRRGFESGKCKTAAKMTVARIKLLRNKRQAVVKQMRRDIALLLQSRQDATARIRVEHVIREQNILDANEFIELFCELIVARLQIIAKQKECPADLKEGIASLIFAAPRCSEIPELCTIKDVFGKKYGKDFVSAAVDLRPSSGVNRSLIEKLSVKTPSGETKLKLMKEIAKEYQIDWDTTESEKELLKPAEEKIEGPKTFVSASSLPVKPAGGYTVSGNSMKQAASFTTSKEMDNTFYQDTESAAEAAAESAKQAVAAAHAAAYLANRGSGNPPNTYTSLDYERFHRRHSYNIPPARSNAKFDVSESVCESDYKGSEDLLSQLSDPKTYRRHSYNPPSAHPDVKFDESDLEDEIEMERLPPPSQSTSSKRDPVPRVHPKLPDYDDLAARFEALKYRK